MSIEYSIAIAHGLIIKKQDILTLSFFPIFTGQDSGPFFEPEPDMVECLGIVQQNIHKVLGSNVAVDLSADQMSGSIEEAIIFYAPSTYRNLNMKYGNEFSAFSVNNVLVPREEETAALFFLLGALGFDESSLGPVVWGSIL